jgi:hypothetical protein
MNYILFTLLYNSLVANTYIWHILIKNLMCPTFLWSFQIYHPFGLFFKKPATRLVLPVMSFRIQDSREPTDRGASHISVLPLIGNKCRWWTYKFCTKLTSFSTLLPSRTETIGWKWTIKMSCNGINVVTKYKLHRVMNFTMYSILYSFIFL